MKRNPVPKTPPPSNHSRGVPAPPRNGTACAALIVFAAFALASVSGAGEARANDYYWSPAIAATTNNTSWLANGLIDGYSFTNFVRDPNFDVIGGYGDNPNGNLNYEYPNGGSGTNLLFGSYLPPSYEFFEYYSSYNPFSSFRLHRMEFNGDAAANGFTLYGGSLRFMANNGESGSISLNNNFANTVENNLSLTSTLLINGGGGGSLNLTGRLTGGGGLNLANSGTTLLSNRASYSGITTIGGGSVLQGGATNAFSAVSEHSLLLKAKVDLNGYNQTIGTLSGGGIGAIITNDGATNATLSLDGGVRSSDFNGTLADGNNGGNLGLSLRASAATPTYQLRLTKADGATYSGVTTIRPSAELIGGVQNALSPNSTHDVQGKLSLEGNSQIIGGLSGSGRVTNSDDYRVSPATLTIGGNGQNTTFRGVITDGGNNKALSLYKQGAGALTLSGNNVYTGGTIVTEGALALNNTNALGGGGVLLEGGTLRFGRIGSASFGAVTLGTGGGEINNNFPITLSQSVSGAGGLTKTGNGVLSLTAANAYTGGTAINAGTLAVNNTSGSGTGTGAVYVAKGATLAGTGAVAGNVVVAAGGIISPGNSPGTLSLLSDLAIEPGGIFLLQIGGTGAGEFDRLLGRGAARFSSALLKIEFLNGFIARPDDAFDFLSVEGAATGTFTILAPVGFQGRIIQQSGTGGMTRFTLLTSGPQGLPGAPAPEPSAASLLLTGLLCITGGVLKRRR